MSMLRRGPSFSSGTGDSREPSPRRLRGPSSPRRFFRTNSTSTASNKSSSVKSAATPPPDADAHAKPPKPSTYEQRRQQFRELLAADKVEYARVQKLAFNGIPDDPDLRPVFWKLMLGYLPPFRAEWDETLRTKRELYRSWVAELVIDPKQLSGGVCEEKEEEAVVDHPLSQDQGSQWSMFFADKEILSEIDKDVRRTQAHMHFFNRLSGSDGQDTDSDQETVVGVKRILFIFAKLNPGIRYVQGMNEILAPLLYVCSADPAVGSFENAEADAFFCFTGIMAEIQDHFIKVADSSQLGINATLNTFSQFLARLEPEVHAKLEAMELSSTFYALRWITLLFSQEFELPDLVRLWDSLFADEWRFEFLLYIAVAMISLQRETILSPEFEFADTLKLLQSYPPTDVTVIFREANRFRMRERGTRVVNG